MIDSNNIEIIRDNLKELDQRIDSLDVEIPPHTSGDAGKYLGVDSSGDLEFSRPIPDTTGSDVGKVLTVNSSGVPAFVTPLPGNLDYSETEQDIGVKWVDGKTIYRKVIISTFPEDSNRKTIGTVGIIDTLIEYRLLTYLSASSSHFEVTGVANSVNASGDVTVQTSISAFYNADVVAILYYTKPDPEPTPETSTKKKKSK